MRLFPHAVRQTSGLRLTRMRGFSAGRPRMFVAKKAAGIFEPAAICFSGIALTAYFFGGAFFVPALLVPAFGVPALGAGFFAAAVPVPLGLIRFRASEALNGN